MIRVKIWKWKKQRKQTRMHRGGQSTAMIYSRDMERRIIPGSICMKEQHKTQRRRRSCSLRAPHNYSSKHNGDPCIKKQLFNNIIQGIQEKA